MNGVSSRAEVVGEIEFLGKHLDPRAPAAPRVVGRPAPVGPARAVGVPVAIGAAVVAPGMKPLHHVAVDRDHVRLGDELVGVGSVGAVAGRRAAEHDAGESRRHDDDHAVATGHLLAVEVVGEIDRRGPVGVVVVRDRRVAERDVHRPRRARPGVDVRYERVAAPKERREGRHVDIVIAASTIGGDEANQFEIGSFRRNEPHAPRAVIPVEHLPVGLRDGADRDVRRDAVRPAHAGEGHARHRGAPAVLVVESGPRDPGSRVRTEEETCRME